MLRRRGAESRDHPLSELRVRSMERAGQERNGATREIPLTVILERYFIASTGRENDLTHRGWTARRGKRARAASSGAVDTRPECLVCGEHLRRGLDEARSPIASAG